MLCGLASTGCSVAARSNNQPVNAMAPAGHPAPAALSSTSRADQPRRQQPREVTREPARVVPASATSRDDSIRAQAEKELGSDVVGSMPQGPQPSPIEPPDPGAAMIVKAIDNALADRHHNDSGVTVISLAQVRNLSRSTPGEFTAFMHRLADLLTRAGRDSKIVFTNKATPAPQYVMQGTAYLMTADGFDQWEMYLSITPAERNFTVWDARNAVRVLRTARPGQPQVTYIGK